MVYEYKTHRIIIENPYKKPTFSLTIGTLEIVVDYDTKQIIYVQGFLPLIKAALEDCVTQSYEGYNEYTYLNQIRICNHWHLSFLSSGECSLRVGG